MKYIKWLMLLVLSLFLFVIFTYNFALFIAHDFNIYFLEIDKCLDHGGRWDYNNTQCEY